MFLKLILVIWSLTLLQWVTSQKGKFAPFGEGTNNLTFSKTTDKLWTTQKYFIDFAKELPSFWNGMYTHKVKLLIFVKKVNIYYCRYGTEPEILYQHLQTVFEYGFLRNIK